MKRTSSAVFEEWRAVMLVLAAGALLLSSISCTGLTVTRRDAMERAQEYISANFPGISVVEFDRNSVEKEDGIWKLVFLCERDDHDEGPSSGSGRVTLYLFVDQDTLQAWGSTVDGWSGLSG